MRLIDLDEFLRQNCIDRIDGKSCDECKHHVLEVSCERLMEQPSAEVTLCHLESPCEYQDANIAMPSVQPEPQKAIWALRTYMPHHYYCTHCKKDSPYNKTWSHCPNCGCEMEGYV